MLRQIKMAQIKTIRALYEGRHSNREISCLTGIHRETVGQYVSTGESKPGKPDNRICLGPTNACKPFPRAEYQQA